MYKIFANDLCIYDDVSSLPEYRLVNPVWKREDNTAGTLTFTMPQSNVGYGIVERLSSRIKILKDDELVWEGRILSEQRNFRKERAITCEGILACLNDTIQPQRELINPTVSSFLSTLLTYHNSKVAADKQFTLGTVTVTADMVDESGDDEYDNDVYIYTNFDSTFNCIAEKLINKSTDPNNDKKMDLRGHLRVRYVNGVRYLDYLKDFPTTSTQIIEFGYNLMDFVIDYDESEFCTALIPLGERYEESEIEGLEGYLDITDVNGGLNYIYNQSAVNAYGWIERVQHFDSITDDEELLAKAREFLSDIQFGKMKLSVTAADLSSLNVNESEIQFLSNVRVKSNPHGLDKFFPVTTLEIPLDNPGNTKFSLGIDDDLSTISSYSNSISSSIKTTMVPEMLRVERAAERTATELIKSATSGYITITTTRNNTQELYITDAPDYTNCNRMWRWNINGLGYSRDGGRSFGLAMTMDGAICADYITTGTLNADQVIVQTGGDSGSKFIINGGDIIGYYDGYEIGRIRMNYIGYFGSTIHAITIGGRWDSTPAQSTELIYFDTKRLCITNPSDPSYYVFGYSTHGAYYSPSDYYALLVQNVTQKQYMTSATLDLSISLDYIKIRSYNGRLQAYDESTGRWLYYDGEGAYIPVVKGNSYSWQLNWDSASAIDAESVRFHSVVGGLITD